jgi:hypothetical protein
MQKSTILVLENKPGTFLVILLMEENELEWETKLLFLFFKIN